MSEPITASEAKQIMDAIQALRGDMQALTLEVRVNQAKNDEQFKALDDKVDAVKTELKAEINAVRTELKSEINAVRAELKSEINAVRTELKSEIKAVNDKVDGLCDELRDDVNELRTQQRSTDGRLWAFIVGLVTLVGSGVIKVLWFDRA